MAYPIGYLKRIGSLVHLAQYYFSVLIGFLQFFSNVVFRNEVAS